MKRYFLEVDGQWQWVWAERIGNEFWFHCNGNTHNVEFKSKTSRRGGNTEFIESGEIKAPMPGKIMKVLKKLGEKVVVGETVIVMEAMKMEYSLEADVTGTLESISVSENDQVNLGQLLASISKEEND
ncbi:MAG: acetyl-CoA carboxylase biotin carboxyl carrier protein subunit [Bdellovibrionales bacterium]|nr:acetyl-CoA carboxylase biotin carboxyl carrier protein subunit [Bdellovibrionales bacterium]